MTNNGTIRRNPPLAMALHSIRFKVLENARPRSDMPIAEISRKKPKSSFSFSDAVGRSDEIPPT